MVCYNFVSFFPILLFFLSLRTFFTESSRVFEGFIFCGTVCLIKTVNYLYHIWRYLILMRNHSKSGTCAFIALIVSILLLPELLLDTLDGDGEDKYLWRFFFFCFLLQDQRRFFSQRRFFGEGLFSSSVLLMLEDLLKLVGFFFRMFCQRFSHFGRTICSFIPGHYLTS